MSMSMAMVEGLGLCITNDHDINDAPCMYLVDRSLARALMRSIDTRYFWMKYIITD